jgi:SAP domain-containing new25
MTKAKLSKSMTEEEFENGYWYAVEIKAFAKELGIPTTAKLRKDELENLIRHFLRSGQVKSASRKILSNNGIKDIERGLALKLPIVQYTSNKETKAFIVQEALKIAPDIKWKSGARYRLNRWREQQIAQGVALTYGDLVRQYVALNRFEGRFPQAPSGRYINFLADFLSSEANSNRAKAIKAWKEVKKLDIPKTYRDWKKYRQSTGT